MAPDWEWKNMTDEIKRLLNETVVLPLWPETGKTVLGLSRGATYSAAAKGQIKTISFGRLRKVPTAWLRQKLRLDAGCRDRPAAEDAREGAV
jgi:hypothetical protein